MKTLRSIIGRICYILAWPGLYLILNNSQRTRVLVYSDGQLLVVKDWLGDGTWKLPGGGIHKNEDPVVSAQRELFEETGIQVNTTQLKPFGTINIKKRQLKSQMHVFGLVVPAGAIVQKHNFEIIDTAWLAVEQVEASKISSTTRAILDKFGQLAF